VAPCSQLFQEHTEDNASCIICRYGHRGNAGRVFYVESRLMMAMTLEESRQAIQTPGLGKQEDN
jgi:hypothetical protein